MKFEELLEKAKEEMRNKDYFSIVAAEGRREILKAYLQYYLIEKTHKLVKATWVLAIATWILAIATILLVGFAR